MTIIFLNHEIMQPLDSPEVLFYYHFFTQLLFHHLPIYFRILQKGLVYRRHELSFFFFCQLVTLILYLQNRDSFFTKQVLL